MEHTEFSWTSPEHVQFYAQDWTPANHVIASITLVHGLGEHSSRYQHLAEYFCERGISVLSYDQRGHGRTEGKRGHIPSYETAAQDTKHFILENHQRHPDSHHFLYGHSLGGAMALYYTMTEKTGIEGTIVTDPGLAPGDPLPPAKLVLAKFMAKVAPSFTLANGLDRENLSHDREVIQRYIDDPLVHDQVSASLGMNLFSKGAWMIENAAKLDLPLHLMYVTKDHLVDLTAIRNFLQNAGELVTSKAWDGFYHEIHNEPEKNEVFDFTINWIKSRIS
jgi:alpha-beta hydrolase superfamily lysophospholipase